MSKNAATEETMGDLHAKVAEVLMSALEDRPYVDPDTGEEVLMPPDARIISTAVTFLNNNKIVMNPYVSDRLTEIEEALSKKTQRFKVVRREAEEEAKKAAGMM